MTPACSPNGRGDSSSSSRSPSACSPGSSWDGAALIAGTVTAWTLTAVLIGPPPLLPVAVGTVYGVIHLAFAVAMLAAACGLTTSAASAVLLTFGVLALMPILGIVPSVKPWLPSELVAAIVFLLDGSPRDFGRSAAAATLASVGLLALAVRLHERREL